MKRKRRAAPLQRALTLWFLAILPCKRNPGMIRADADEEDKKPEVPEEEVADEDRDGEGNGGNGKVLEAVNKLADLVSGLVDRVDALETNGMTDEDVGEEEGEARRVAADSRERRKQAYHRLALQRRDAERFADIEQYMTPKNADFFAAAQARCDSCASAYGSSAPRPMDGESLRAYKIRLIRPYQRASKTFKDIDLHSVANAQLFEKIESTIYDEARQDANNPTLIPQGMLRRDQGQDGCRAHYEYLCGPPYHVDGPIHAHWPGRCGDPCQTAHCSRRPGNAMS